MVLTFTSHWRDGWVIVRKYAIVILCSHNWVKLRNIYKYKGRSHLPVVVSVSSIADVGSSVCKGLLLYFGRKPNSVDSISKSGLRLSTVGGLSAFWIDLTWSLDFLAVSCVSATVSYCGAFSDLRRREVDSWGAGTSCPTVLFALTREATSV